MTLSKHSESTEYLLDAATLLRAMFEAWIQAQYIFDDGAKREEKATLYLDFEHRDRRKMMEKVLSHDNSLSDRLRASPKRTPEAEARLQREYGRVKPNYSNNYWYSRYGRDLRILAQAVGKVDEYDSFVSTYQGCVHSGSMAIEQGPLLNSQIALMKASMIVARVAKINAAYNRFPLNEVETENIDEICKSPLEG